MTWKIKNKNSMEDPVTLNFKKKAMMNLTVGLGDTFDFVLLLDGVAVGGAAGRVDYLVRETLGDGLHVSEGGLPGAHGHEVDGVVDPSEGRDVHCLSLHRARSAHSGRVLARTAIYDGFNQELDRVLVGEDVDQLEGVADNAARHELLAVVASEPHERASQTLNHRALLQIVITCLKIAMRVIVYLSLLEALSLVSACGMSHKSGMFALHCDKINQRDILNLNVLQRPLSK